jgi:hypothetical protein
MWSPAFSLKFKPVLVSFQFISMCAFRKALLDLIAATTTMALATVSLVHDLTNNTFRAFVEENNMVLVGFVLPFLPVSQRFLREYQEV